MRTDPLALSFEAHRRLLLLKLRLRHSAAQPAPRRQRKSRRIERRP